MSDRIKLLTSSLIVLLTAAPACLADDSNYWNNLDKRYPNLNKPWRVPGEIQKPGEIKAPTREIQKPGEIQIPRGMKAITQAPSPCSQRFTVGADALFEFDKSTLNSFAKETLNALKPLLVKLGSHPVKVEGHTDSKGTDQYNQTLSEKRAEQVKNWLIENGVASTAAISTKGFGSLRPVARNANPDGSDNPEGRAKNRRVEIVVDTCTKLEQVPKASSTDGGSKSP